MISLRCSVSGTFFPVVAFFLLSLSSLTGGRSATSSVSAQEVNPAPVSSAATADVPVDRAALEEVIERMRGEWKVPGLAVAIVKDDQTILSKGFGVLRQGASEPVDGETLFAIASNSKAFTAAALAILVDEGKLRWDDRVHKYLPWLQLNDPLAASDLRIHDLLCHRSGLGTFSGDLLWWGTPYSVREILERSVHLEPASPFRTEYGYSNLMYLAAGEVIRTVSGQSWGEFIAARILKPLQMDRTVTTVQDLLPRGNFATPHKTVADESIPILWADWDSMAAAGGIISSSNDMARWMKMQLRQGALQANEPPLFTADRSREMWEAYTPIPISPSSSARFPSTHFRAYGLGWSLSDYHGRKLVGHGGAYDGMYSQVMLVPEERLGIVVLTNSMTSFGSALTYSLLDQFLTGSVTRNWSEEMRGRFAESQREFRARIERAITPVAAGTKPSHPLAAYAGTFRCPMYGDCRIEVEGESLVLRLLPNPLLVADLQHLHYDTFVIRWRQVFAWFDAGTAHFVADAKGNFIRLELDVPNDDFWFHELRLRRLAN